MKARWLNLFIRLSSTVFQWKRDMVETTTWWKVLWYAFKIVLGEVVIFFVSLPLFVMVSPQEVQENGFMFPRKEEVARAATGYAIRRKISVMTLLSAGSLWILKVLLIGVISTFLLGGQLLLAASQDWTFSTPGDYTYDGNKIEVTGGVAHLVDQGTGHICSGTATACTTFVTSPSCVAQAGCAWGGGASGSSPAWSTTWGTYSDWENGANVSGSSPTTGGNPTNYKNIAITRNNAAQTASGYWQQSFTTTAANPDTATINFDWSIKSYNGTYLTSYIIYVFVDNFSGAPTIGNQVWSQTVTGTTGWATVSNLNVASKLTAAGPYYIKLVARRIKIAGTPPNVDNTVGWDNVSLTWTKNNSCSGTVTACNTFVTSPACIAQSGCSWNNVPVYPTDLPTIYHNTPLNVPSVTAWTAFTETATKNGGEIYYQLSDDNGSTWKYWNNTAWAAAGATNYNTAAVVNSHISGFSLTNHSIKWKAFLSSNGSQQVTLDNISIGYTENDLPRVTNVSVAQQTSTNNVNIAYALADNNSDTQSLSAYEYSLTGAFAGEQGVMTASSSDPAHSGVVGLTSSPGGTAHTFVWNAFANVGHIYSTSTYIRLRANDGFGNSIYATSTPFTIDYVVPVISNVSAVQTLGGTAVQIGYDLFDQTANNLNVELEISGDGGATWTVPTTSATGAVGAGQSAGVLKSITWQAGTDYPNHEQANVMIRLRARDNYQNQGNFVNSANVVIDTRAPAISTAIDLLAQPNAGDSTVLLGGSFTEGNPNSNDFYVAINGGAYGTATPGTLHTATPANQATAVGVTLRGNDYISKIKLVHADQYGHVTENENMAPTPARVYVKPYTPAPPPLVSDPMTSSVNVTIYPNTNEVSGLEYAVQEVSTGRYVQADGSLGSDAVWEVLGTGSGQWGEGSGESGKVNVHGLDSPLAQYSFRTKSRNSADSLHQASSESNFSGAGTLANGTPDIAAVSGTQPAGTTYVRILYTGSDPQGDLNHLVAYDYSTDGATWQPMTEKTGLDSDGINNLLFASGGTGHVFLWNAAADLAAGEYPTVYVHLKSSDGLIESNEETSSVFSVDVGGPVISNISVQQNDGSHLVDIQYDIADGSGTGLNVTLSMSNDSGVTYTVPVASASGDVGSGVTAGVGLHIVWNAGADFGGHELNTMRVKLAAVDSFTNAGAPEASGDFPVDTLGPLVSNVVATVVPHSTYVTVTYDVADVSTSNLLVAFDVSDDSGATWNVTTSTVSGDVGNGLTAGSKTFTWNAGVDWPNHTSAGMIVRVHAFDTWGNQGGSSESGTFTIDTAPPVISAITAAQTAGTDQAVIHYNLSDDQSTVAVSIELSDDGGVTWSVATSTVSGHVGTAVPVGINKTISWNAGTDFNNREVSAMRVGLRAVDQFGNDSLYISSGDWSIDTAAPLGLANLHRISATGSSVSLGWSASNDANFNHYELWHGANKTDVESFGGTATEWGPANDADLTNMATITTVITGISLNQNYYVAMRAIDNHGHTAGVPSVNVYEVIPATTPTTGGSYVPNPPSPSPKKPILAPLLSPTDNPLITLSGTADPLAHIDLFDGGVFIKQLASPADGNGFFKESFTVAAGSHSFSIRATDITGTLSELSDPVTVEVTTILPMTPAIIFPKNNDTVIDGLEIIGLATPLERVEIIMDQKNIFESTADQTGGWRFIVPNAEQLTPGTHMVSVRGVSAAGRRSAESSINVLKVLPAAPPIILPPVLPGIPSIAAPITPLPTPGPAIPAQPTVILPVIARAVSLPAIPAPTVAAATVASTGDTLTFSGTSLPNADIVVYIHSSQAVLYETRADALGHWAITHSQTVMELAPGNHSIYAITLDAAHQVKSQPSAIGMFTVQKHWWAVLYRYLDLSTTIAAVLVLAVTILWLYRRRQTAVA